MAFVVSGSQNNIQIPVSEPKRAPGSLSNTSWPPNLTASRCPRPQGQETTGVLSSPALPQPSTGSTVELSDAQPAGAKQFAVNKQAA